MGAARQSKTCLRGRFLATMTVAFLLVTAFAPAAWALRCGNDLVSIGDHSFQVIEKCGEPIVKEFVGYTLQKNLRREFVIEKWVYGPKAGYYDVLIFVGGVLKEMSSVKR